MNNFFDFYVKRRNVFFVAEGRRLQYNSQTKMYETNDLSMYEDKKSSEKLGFPVIVENSDDDLVYLGLFEQKKDLIFICSYTTETDINIFFYKLLKDGTFDFCTKDDLKNVSNLTDKKQRFLDEILSKDSIRLLIATGVLPVNDTSYMEEVE
jgi:hypothetical protein